MNKYVKIGIIFASIVIVALVADHLATQSSPVVGISIFEPRPVPFDRINIDIGRYYSFIGDMELFYRLKTVHLLNQRHNTSFPDRHIHRHVQKAKLRIHNRTYPILTDTTALCPNIKPTATMDIRLPSIRTWTICNAARYVHNTSSNCTNVPNNEIDTKKQVILGS